MPPYEMLLRIADVGYALVEEHPRRASLQPHQPFEAKRRGASLDGKANSHTALTFFFDVVAPWKSRNFAMKRNRLAIIGRRVVAAWKQFLPTALVVFEELEPRAAIVRRRPGRPQPNRVFPQHVDACWLVNKSVNVRALLRQHGDVQHVS